MNRYFASLFVWACLSVSLEAQIAPQKITWRQLGTTRFEEIFDVSKNIWTQKAIFPPDISVLNGKKVRITGYMVPVDATGNVYALSAYTFSSCFFCGGAGPESVMGLEFKGLPKKYKTDQIVSLQGTFSLVSKPGMGFYFVLREVAEWTE